MTDPITLMVHLQKTNSNALGFIPERTLRERILRQGTYLLSKDRHNKPNGFLIHSPLYPSQVAYLHQVCIDFDHRRRENAARTVAALLKRARAAGVLEIRLKCAADLDANAFWSAIGAIHLKTTDPGNTRRRLIHHYCIPVEDRPCPLFPDLNNPNADPYVSAFLRRLSTLAAQNDGSSPLPAASTP